MDFFDWFSPEQAQASQLRRIANSAQTANMRAGAQREDIDTLERENRELRLYLTAVIQTLVDKGLLTIEEIQQKVLSMLPLNLELPTDESAENPFANLKLE